MRAGEWPSLSVLSRCRAPLVPELREAQVSEIARESDGRPMFAMDADLTVYWPWVRPCWEEDA